MRHCLPVCSPLWKRIVRSHRPQPLSEILRQPQWGGRSIARAPQKLMVSLRCEVLGGLADLSA